MKLLRYSFALAIACTGLLACSKDKEDDASSNWSESFKNTTWAGEYQLSSGENTSTQPFSIQLAADGTLTWYDVESKRPGGVWVIDHDTIRITLPNSTVIAATVSQDSWSGFKGGNAAGFVISQVSRAAEVNPASLVGNSFAGTLRGTPLTITLLADQKLIYTVGGTNPSTLSYTVEGAGIRFNNNGIGAAVMNYVLITGNNTTMKGFERRVSGLPPKTSYYLFTANKQ